MIAIVVMVLTPLFFSTNLIFGRGVIGEVAPFTLAMIRWAAVALVLTPFVLLEWEKSRALMSGHPRFVLLLGFLGMWVCGGMVYFGLQQTTATNGTLIYTTSSVFILLLDAAYNRRPITLRQAAGSALALCGVATIVFRGDPAAVLDLDFNIGDLIFVATSMCWAVYSLLLRSPRVTLPSDLALLSLTAATGAVLLLPLALWEYWAGAPMPTTPQAWRGIAGIVVFSSLFAFLGFQFGVRRLGASTAGVFMYLLPVYGVAMAVIFLGEEIHPYHLAGVVFVMGGVVIATVPKRTSR